MRYGPIANLEMAAMPMTFCVKSLTMLDQIKVGQKIRFEVAPHEGQLTVMRFEPVQ